MNAHLIAFADDSCMNEVCSDYLNNVEVMDVSFDEDDGSDWWFRYLNNIEEKYGDKWRKVIIYSDDLTVYRRFDRSFHYLRNVNNINQSVVPRLILFGFESLERAKPTFSSNIIIDETNHVIDDVNRFKIGFDDMPIYIVTEIGYFKKEIYKQILVILNPQESQMAFAKLGEQYNRAIYLRDSADWEKMEDSFFEYTELIELKDYIDMLLHKLEYRNASSVRVLNNSANRIQSKIDGFLDYFCNLFPLKN